MSPIFGQDTLDFISHSEAQTRRLGQRLAVLLRPGDVLALNGALGTGKTRWAQGVCRGLGVTDPVNSPTFTLVNEYEGRYPVYHIDLYRLGESAESFANSESPAKDEALTFGLEEYLYGNGITLIEWAERAKILLPPDYLAVELYHLEDTKRRIVLRSRGQRFKPVLATFKEKVFTPTS